MHSSSFSDMNFAVQLQFASCCLLGDVQHFLAIHSSVNITSNIQIGALGLAFLSAPSSFIHF
jgi:hypothetical protein